MKARVLQHPLIGDASEDEREHLGVNMEPVTFAIGGAVAKWAFKLWAGDTPFADVGADLADIVGQRISEPYQSRRVRRQFESLADEIAKRIEPYLSHETGGMDAAEREAVCLAAKETIERAVLDPRSLLALDLDPLKIRSYMIEANPEAETRNALSEAGGFMYNALLTEVSEYVSATAGSLPGFATQQAAELLARDSLIIDLLKDVLNKLPVSTVPGAWGSGSSDTYFENEYRRHIFRYADKLQLFGVSSAVARSSYSLSVAYISMSVSSSPGGSGARSKKDVTADPEFRISQPDYVSVEEAVGKNPYVMVSGSAGSGKTTLVQWIASSAANKSFTGQLQRWNSKIPFILPLRRFVHRGLPRPEEFVYPVVPEIAGMMPDGWVHRILHDGKAIVLVDGLDEMPADRRKEAKEWLERLIEAFPSNQYIITSRSTALSSELTDNKSFHYTSLLPMEYAEIRSFVAHWHAAALKNAASPDERDSIRTSEQLILATIRDKSGIKSLCNSPLLCALVCALNRERAGNIPENRMELYETALQMLVVRRDEARRIPIPENVSLTYSESSVLLRSFSLWMHENALVDAELTQFEERIGQQLRSLHRVTSVATKEEVANHLLVRSGVLREPIPGRVDFVHRTFLEYLAAAAVVDDDSIGKLVQHGHEDYWREVIILAAGHAKSSSRERLTRGLIQRGKSEPDHTHSLFLLAVACMETSTDLSPELQEELTDCLRSVMPPGNMTDAAAVASAGSVAVSLLASFRGNALPTAACVRALVLIGGEESLRALANFGTDTRVTVARELIRGWSYFDSDIYLGTVLKDSPLDAGRIRIRDIELLRIIDRLSNLKRIFVDSYAAVVDFSGYPDVQVPISFYFGSKSGLLNLATFARFPKARGITIRNSATLISLAGIELLEDLSHLDFEGCFSLSSVDACMGLPKLVRLDLSGTAVSSLPTRAASQPLQYLNLSGCDRLVSLGERVNARKLNILRCPSLVDMSALASSDVVETLFMSSPTGPQGVHLPPNLRELVTYDSVQALSGADKLQRLEIRHSSQKGDFIDFIMARPSITEVDLGFVISADSLDQLSALAAHPGLSKVELWLEDEKHDVPELLGFKTTKRRRWIVYSK